MINGTSGLRTKPIDPLQQVKVGALAPRFYTRVGIDLQHCADGVFSDAAGAITPFCSGICPVGTTPGWSNSSNGCSAGCSEGFYCPGALSPPIPCPTGHYCPVDSSAPIACPTGRYGNTTQLSNASCSGPCPAGYWCEVGTGDPPPCLSGSYCPEGTTTLEPCAPGRFGNGTGYTNDQCEGICPPGFECKAGTADYSLHPCTEGYYCPKPGTVNGYICLVGHYCVNGSVNPVGCSEGKYGDREGLTSSMCSGDCLPGFYCPKNSTSPTQTICPAGSYCGAGAPQPLLCKSGYFCPSGSSVSTPFPCGARSLYCPTGSAAPMPVSEQYYGSQPYNASTPTLAVATQTNQTLCESGHFCDGSGLMKPCPNGTYADEIGMTACKPCPTGSYSYEAWSSCISCTSGRYTPRPDQPCVDCSFGRFSVGSATSCQGCSPGRTANARSSACEECDSGRFSINPEEPCTDCSKGRYSLGGASTCSECEVGTASNVTGRSTPCKVCELGREYASTAGREECAVCSPPFYSPDPSLCIECHARITNNGTTCDTTPCPANTEWSLTDQLCVTCPLGQHSVSGGECTPCPQDQFTPHVGSGCISCLQSGMEGIVCSGGLASVKEGYWAYQRLDPTTNMMLYYSTPCPNGFCPGSPLQSDANNPDPSPSPSLPYQYCEPPRLDSSSNIMCGECADGYIPWGSSCAECDGPNGGLIFSLILLSLCLTAILIRSSVSTISAGGQVVLLYFIQTAALQVGELSSLTSWITFVNFDVLFAGNKQCIADLTPYQQTLFAILTPLLLGAEVIILALAHWIIHRHCIRHGVTVMEDDGMNSNHSHIHRLWSHIRRSSIRFFLTFHPSLYLRSFLSVLLFCYTSVSYSCFSYLRCVDVGGESRLFSSPSVECDSEEYEHYLIPVGIILTLYVVAFPIGVTLFLFTRRNQIIDTSGANNQGQEEVAARNGPSIRDNIDTGGVAAVVPALNMATKSWTMASTPSTCVESPLSRRWGPLYSMYESRAWYWQPLVLVRRMLFTLTAVLLINDAGQRYLWFNLLNIVTLLSHIYTNPFSKSSFNHAEAASHALLLLISTLLAAEPQIPPPSWLQVLLFVFIIPPVVAFGIYLAYHGVIAVRRRSNGKGNIHVATDVRMEQLNQSEGHVTEAPASPSHPHNQHTAHINSPSSSSSPDHPPPPPPSHALQAHKHDVGCGDHEVRNVSGIELVQMDGHTHPPPSHNVILTMRQGEGEAEEHHDVAMADHQQADSQRL